MERIKRWKRYLRFLLQVILLEKPRGLDFTLRDQKLFQKSGGKYHGYSKTDERHLRDIFQKLDFSKGLKLLDVGCGKGVVLREAAKFPFKRIAGIEISSELVRIARKNSCRGREFRNRFMWTMWEGSCRKKECLRRKPERMCRSPSTPACSGLSTN